MSDAHPANDGPLPLTGIRVVEFTHMVMGPTCGMVLAELEIPADASSANRPLHTRAPLLPLTLDGRRPPLRRGPPSIGEHTAELLAALGCDDPAVAALRRAGVVVG